MITLFLALRGQPSLRGFLHGVISGNVLEICVTSLPVQGGLGKPLMALQPVSSL